MARGIDWVAEGWGYRPDSIDSVLFAINRIGVWAHSRRYAFRGVKDHRWSITSSLQRFVAQHHGTAEASTESWIRQAEIRLLTLARRWELDEGGRASDQMLLALLQHHGTPTRFVDVTSDPMTALWFATEPTVSWGSHGVVFAFDITQLETLSTSLPASTSAPAMPVGYIANPQGYHYRRLLDESERRQAPFVVQPYPRDQRMTAQQGFFLAGSVPGSPLVGGLDAFPLDARPPGADRLQRALSDVRRRGFPARIPFLAIVVPRHLKAPIREALASTWNRRRQTLFPDLGGLADAIVAQPDLIMVDATGLAAP